MVGKLKDFDRQYYSDKVRLIAGVDEAGRGPLAGPLVAAAVIFDEDVVIEGINDSKKLSFKKREELYKLIKQKARSIAVTLVRPATIDKINILKATLMAMRKSVSKLNPTPDLILVDGNQKFKSEIPLVTIIKGDALSFSIAAASIVAKVTRDRMMINAAKKYPGYFWEANKGYGTKQHMESIKEFGISPLHRKSFLKNIFIDENQTNN